MHVQFSLVPEKTVVRDHMLFIVVQANTSLPQDFQVRFQPKDAVPSASQELEYFLSHSHYRVAMEVPRKAGELTFLAQGKYWGGLKLRIRT